MAKLELEVDTDVLLLETGDALLLEVFEYTKSASFGLVPGTVSRLLEGVRPLSLQLGVAPVAERIGEFIKELTTLLGLALGSARTLGISRAISTAIGLALKVKSGMGKALATALGLVSIKMFGISKVILTTTSLVSSRTKGIGRAISTKLGLTSNISRLLEIVRPLLTQIGIAPLSERVGEFFRELTTLLGLRAAVTRLEIVGRSFTATAGLVSSIKSTINISRKMLATTGLLAVRGMGIARGISSAVGLTSIITRGVSTVKQVGLGLIPPVDRLAKIKRTLQIRLGFTLLTEGPGNIVRRILAQVGVISVSSREISIKRIFEPLEGLVRTIERTLEIKRTFSTTTGVLSIFKRGVSKAINTALGLSSTVARTIELARTIITTIGVAPLSERLGEFLRTLVTQLGLKALSTRARTFVRPLIPLATTLPTGHVAGDWSNEGNSYDGSTTTYALWGNTGLTDWGPYLQLTHGGVQCGGVIYYSFGNGISTDIDIDVYYDGGWHDVSEGTLVENTWVKIDFPDGRYHTVTAVRARVRIDIIFKWNSIYELGLLSTGGVGLVSVLTRGVSRPIETGLSLASSVPRTLEVARSFAVQAGTVVIARTTGVFKRAFSVTVGLAKTVSRLFGSIRKQASSLALSLQLLRGQSRNVLVQLGEAVSWGWEIGKFRLLTTAIGLSTTISRFLITAGYKSLVFVRSTYILVYDRVLIPAGYKSLVFVRGIYKLVYDRTRKIIKLLGEEISFRRGP